MHVQVVRPASTPIEHHGSPDLLQDAIFDERLDRREPGAARQQYDGLVTIVPQEEGTQRPFEAQDVAHPHLCRRGREHLVRECAPRNVPNVELNLVCKMGSPRHRVTASLAIFENQFNVLASQVLKPLGRGQLQERNHDVRRNGLNARDTARKFADRDVTRTLDFARLDDEIIKRMRAAKERVSLQFLLGRQGRGLVHCMFDMSGHKTSLARAACAVPAAIWQANPRPKRRCKDGVFLHRAKLVPARLNRHRKCHVQKSEEKMRRPLGTRRNGEMSVRPFAKPRILIVGCGDVGLRLASRLNRRFDVIGTARSANGLAAIRAAGARALKLDLDQPLPAALSAPAAWVVHLAPPDASGTIDRRTRRLIGALRGVSRLIYVSTSGVYGDCRGELVDETHNCKPRSERAKRRLDAERALRTFARAQHVRLSILRVPGIYALERLPRERLEAGLPALDAAEDVFTNHIHADDLALALEAALYFGRPMRLYNASDDSQLRMGEYFDRVADLLSLPRPPRSSLAEVRKALSPMQLSFMEESRRLVNHRLKDELGVRLRFPTVESMLANVRG